MDKQITNSRFADDIILVVNNSEMVEMIKDVKSLNENFRLFMNLSKSKFMSNRERANDFRLDGAKIDRVDEYRYLG